ncbi:uncharacterized protein LOC105010326 [Esox lucius]|uniref:uncharacterized protein LOC105010326 n=1 Tax=Esox lucius TaxID=8010 RepID=UPI0014774E61|nr:uncharacterized protein LOC105010326 [Esox lucius]
MVLRRVGCSGSCQKTDLASELIQQALLSQNAVQQKEAITKPCQVSSFLSWKQMRDSQDQELKQSNHKRPKLVVKGPRSILSQKQQQQRNKPTGTSIQASGSRGRKRIGTDRLLFAFLYAQLWLVLCYRHKRFSYQTAFLFLCLLWAALRALLFSFYFRDCVTANALGPFAFWLLYCFPVCLQFFTLSLMNLYCAQVGTGLAPRGHLEGGGSWRGTLAKLMQFWVSIRVLNEDYSWMAFI